MRFHISYTLVWTDSTQLLYEQQKSELSRTSVQAPHHPLYLCVLMRHIHQMRLKKIHLPPHLSTTADAATFSLPLIPLRCNMQSFMFTLEPTAIRAVQLFLSKQPNENSDGAVLLALHVHSTLSICFAVSKSDIFACFFCPGSTLYICLCSNDDKHYTLLFTH